MVGDKSPNHSSNPKIEFWVYYRQTGSNSILVQNRGRGSTRLAPGKGHTTPGGGLLGADYFASSRSGRACCRTPGTCWTDIAAGIAFRTIALSHTAHPSRRAALRPLRRDFAGVQVASRHVSFRCNYVANGRGSLRNGGDVILTKKGSDGSGDLALCHHLCVLSLS